MINEEGDGDDDDDEELLLLIIPYIFVSSLTSLLFLTFKIEF
jgi:hypothetical protein